MARKRNDETAGIAPIYTKGAAVFDAVQMHEDNIIGKRLLELRKAAGWTAEELCGRLEAYRISLLRGAISKWETGVTAPSTCQLLALCNIYGIDDPAAYFTGAYPLNTQGMRKLADYKNDLISSGLYTPAEDPVNNITYLEKPVSYLAASAGTGCFLDDGNFEMKRFPASSVPRGAEFGVHVAGDSMEPVYIDGQIVWVQPCESLRPGEVGIFILDGCGYIKCYGERQPEDPEQFTDSYGVLHKQSVLISYNEKYDPIIIGPDNRLEIVGRVLN